MSFASEVRRQQDSVGAAGACGLSSILGWAVAVLFFLRSARVDQGRYSRRSIYPATGTAASIRRCRSTGENYLRDRCFMLSSVQHGPRVWRPYGCAHGNGGRLDVIILVKLSTGGMVDPIRESIARRG